MNKFLMSTAGLLLLAAPAMAQQTTVITTQTAEQPGVVIAPPPPVTPSTSYQERSVVHSTDGSTSRTDSRSEETVNPDGSTQSQKTVIHEHTGN